MGRQNTDNRNHRLRRGQQNDAPSGVSARRQRVVAGILMGLVLASLAALGGRIYYIQRTMGNELLAWARNRQIMTIPLPARRGSILDRRGRVLAGTVMRPSVAVDPAVLADPQDTARRLAPILGLDPRELAHTLAARRNRRFLWIKRRIDRVAADAVRSLGIYGVLIVEEPQRIYPMRTLAAHVVGFTDIDGRGLEGIEKRFDAELAGRPGHRRVMRDAAGRAVWEVPDAYLPPQDGHDVVLTIDAVIQEIAERHLRTAVQERRAECGVVVVMEPRTGEVLAMASYPTFDPNRRADYPASARRNRVLTDPVEPGSTFKPFVAAAALEEGVTHLGDPIFCHNGLYVTGSRRLHDHHPYGTLTFEQVVIKSSNIGMAILGERLGNRRMWEHIRRFGFGEPTGIELPGESAGLVLPLSKWTRYSTTSVPMGQELAITPIQLVTAFSALVNDGVLLRPRVVRAITDHDGRIIRDRSAPIVVRRAISARVAAIMAKNVLVRVVNEGTGRRARLERYQVLGKTGTAQVPRRGRRGYEPDAYLSSFVGAVPARDPRIAVLVMIRKPKGAYYGGTVAAPVVREIMAETLAYLKVPPDPSGPELAAGRLGAGR